MRTEAPAPSARCSAPGCFTRLQPGMVFCPTHWNALPRVHRDALYSAKVKPEKYAGAKAAAAEWLLRNRQWTDKRNPTMGNHFDPEDYKAEQEEQDRTDAFVAKVACIAHEANRAYCRALGDNSQMGWQDAPPWQHKSAIAGVRFTLANPEASPAASHESWLAEKRADGWIYGPVKDAEAKQHPCFVPYDMLPQEQRAKDYIFQAVVRSVVAQFREGR